MNESIDQPQNSPQLKKETEENNANNIQTAKFKNILENRLILFSLIALLILILATSVFIYLFGRSKQSVSFSEQYPKLTSESNKFEFSESNKYDDYALGLFLSSSSHIDQGWAKYQLNNGSFEYPSSYYVIVLDDTQNKIRVGIYKDKKTIDEIKQCEKSQMTQQDIKMGVGLDCLSYPIIAVEGIEQYDKNTPNRGSGSVLTVNRKYHPYAVQKTNYENNKQLVTYEVYKMDDGYEGEPISIFERDTLFTSERNIGFSNDPEGEKIKRINLKVLESEISDVELTLTTNEIDRDSILQSLELALYPFNLKDIFLNKEVPSSWSVVNSENNLYSYKYSDNMYQSPRPDYGDVYYFFDYEDYINWEKIKIKIEKGEEPHGLELVSKNIMVRFDEEIPEVKNKYTPYFKGLVGKSIKMKDINDMYITVVEDVNYEDGSRVMLFRKKDTGEMTMEFSVFYRYEDLDVVTIMTSSFQALE